MTTITDRPALTPVAGACTQLAVGRTKLYELIAAGELHAVKLGRLTRITQESLDAYVDRLKAS